MDEQKHSYHAACTCVPRAVTPSLTRLRLDVETLELIELIDSWLPLRSRDSVLRGWLARIVRGTGGTVAPGIVFTTLCTGANSPNMGLHSKYLSKKTTATYCTTGFLSSYIMVAITRSRSAKFNPVSSLFSITNNILARIVVNVK